MMREVMQRRFSRLIKDHGEESPNQPAVRMTAIRMP
jgi:excinuclease UvrABC nuclease subunit